MEIQAFCELFPLFNTANQETIEWLLSVIQEEEYEPNIVILTENTWGTAVYFIVSGWVKIQRDYGEHTVTQDILGRGDFFGEMAILDEYPSSTEVITLSDVKLFSISAQRFIQTLFRDAQIHHRLLKLFVRRLRTVQNHYLLHKQPPKVKLIKTLISLADNYGEFTEKGIEILNIADSDLAQLANIDLKETTKIKEKLKQNGCLEIDTENQILCLTNIKQLNHLAGRFGND